MFKLVWINVSLLGVFVLNVVAQEPSTQNSQLGENKLVPHLVSYGRLAVIEPSDAKEIAFSLADQTDKYVISSNFEVVEKATALGLEKGLVFGIHWAFSGLPEDLNGQAVELKCEVEHPIMKANDGNLWTKRSYTVNEQVSSGVISSMFGWKLNKDYELVPGMWKFTVEYEGEKVEKKFVMK